MTDEAVVEARRLTVITDLGAGVDATRQFSSDAIERVRNACSRFVCEARTFGARSSCTTLTSAARDAGNADILLEKLADLGLEPQVIPGEVEARLTFYGVARDFDDERIVVVDSGGGSTEFATGAFDASRRDVRLEHVRSLDIGCRRVTDRFLQGDPPSADQIASARSWARAGFSRYWPTLAERPHKLVAVGGTVTTLVALTHGLKDYDASFVHLRQLALSEVESAIERMRDLPVREIAELAGIQPKRAPVILAGALIIAELMRAGGYDSLTVSENSLLVGLAATIGEELAASPSAIGWTPRLAVLED
ncbi:hypothetical protein [Coriobacterium glomerans]|uniref:Ppx/GppA phosphatase family protein n=1 Tax=Coriobacterium glomerans TaxID=33871 RepID=UPI001FE13C7F|nr:hypothetical protein [Coriobacterium glomerans]